MVSELIAQSNDQGRVNGIERKIAVLIDADNVSSKYIKPILDELSKFGAPTYKRIYSDWTKPEMAGWKNVLLTYSITPVQQYSFISGKNATDSNMIIEAMDILYTGHVDSFCIVSSDSDFTRLAGRLREAGMYVIGMGEKKTPQSFISACEVFRYLEVLLSDGLIVAAEGPEPVMAREGGRVPGSKESAETGYAERKPSEEADLSSSLSNVDEITGIIQKIVADTSDEDGWAFLGNVGNLLNKQKPDFDSRNYGYPKLTLFVKSLNRFDIEHRATNNPGIKHTFIRVRAGGRVSKKILSRSASGRRKTGASK